MWHINRKVMVVMIRLILLDPLHLFWQATSNHGSKQEESYAFGILSSVILCRKNNFKHINTDDTQWEMPTQTTNYTIYQIYRVINIIV